MFSSEDGGEEPGQLCEYEKLREKNIKERMKKLAESKYFGLLVFTKVKKGWNKHFVFVMSCLSLFDFTTQLAYQSCPRSTYDQMLEQN